jgi:hypothetical protein
LTIRDIITAPIIADTATKARALRRFGLRPPILFGDDVNRPAPNECAMPWLLLIGVTPAALRESDQAPATTNLAFGGDDLKTLYFTSRNHLGAVNVKIPGVPVPPQRDKSPAVVWQRSQRPPVSTGSL